MTVSIRQHHTLHPLVINLFRISNIDIPGDFKLDFRVEASQGTGTGFGVYMVGVADNTKLPHLQTGDGISNSLYASQQGIGSTGSNSWKAGVRDAQGGTPALSQGVWAYGRMERIGSNFTVKFYTDDGRQIQTGGTSSHSNVYAGALTTLMLLVAGGTPGGFTASNSYGEWELWNGVTQRYSSTSPVVPMGWVSKAIGTVIRGVGNLPINLPSGTTVEAEYRANNGPWSTLFATVAAMNAFLFLNPETITNPVNSFDMRLTLNSNGDNTPEVFIVEGPDLTGAGGGGAASPTFGGGVISA